MQCVHHLTYKIGARQYNFHSSRTSGQPIILPYCSCSFQVDRPSGENHQPRDTVLRSNFPIILSIERFSFECRKVIGFAFTTLRDWLKKLAPLFHPIRSKPKAIVIHSYAFSRTFRHLNVITSCFDWFN